MKNVDFGENSLILKGFLKLLIIENPVDSVFTQYWNLWKLHIFYLQDEISEIFFTLRKFLTFPHWKRNVSKPDLIFVNTEIFPVFQKFKEPFFNISTYGKYSPKQWADQPFRKNFTVFSTYYHKFSTWFSTPVENLWKTMYYSKFVPFL